MWAFRLMSAAKTIGVFDRPVKYASILLFQALDFEGMQGGKGIISRKIKDGPDAFN